MNIRKKLIEVALPLEAINIESAREKSLRHGHPSTLHLWWARRPTAAARAVLWASLVDDPSSWPDKFPTEEDQMRERQRLFDILGRIEIVTDKKGNQKQVVRGLVSWDDIKDPAIIEKAQQEIARCLAWERGEEPPTTPDAVGEYISRYAPPAYDPFAGGGTIPLEAQRLGLEAHASDLNPVAVSINKALIEIPPKFKDRPPVNPEDQKRKVLESWKGTQGLAADVSYYGQWMRDEAFKRIGHLYPQVEGKTVIAWIWTRTVKCPNPACGCQMPLVKNFSLSTKNKAWVEPMVEKEGTNNPKIRFEVKTGKGKAPLQLPSGTTEGTVGRKGARCIACGTPVPLEHLRSEGKARRMGQQLMAIVVEGEKGRIYLSPTDVQEKIAFSAQPEWKPETELPESSLGIRVPPYGMTKHGDLFTDRQLMALTTFSDLVSEAKERATQDAKLAGDAEQSNVVPERRSLSVVPERSRRDDVPLNNGGTGARAYGEAIATYLGFCIDRLADRNSTICSWDISRDSTRNTFGRQAIPMIWDFVEANPFSDSTGNFNGAIEWITKVLENNFPWPGSRQGYTKAQVTQQEATANHKNDSTAKLISTDPPYYDAVPYADLSDFFYVWLRKSIGNIYPDLFSTLLVPKEREMVADKFRHGSHQKAKYFFESSLIKVFNRLNRINHPDYPVTVYYALKQTETDSNEQVASTGWETILEGLMQANFSIDGTWPLRTELSNRMRAQSSNALASSIVLVCRPRPENAPKTTRRQFLSQLKRSLPLAIKTLQQGNIAPVDLAQASIGPGMEVFSKYATVLENDGARMGVRTALQLINQILDEFLSEQEGEFDGDTRWALTWFEQYQFQAASYGEAETLSKAKNTSIQGMVEAGILEAVSGKVRLLKREELLTVPEKSDWVPKDNVPDWGITQYLIRELDKKGELGAGELLAKLGDRGEIARDLAYRLYNLCDRKGWAQEAIQYNSLVISWPEISRLAREFQSQPVQGNLF